MKYVHVWTFIGSAGFVIATISLALAIIWGADDRGDLRAVTRKNCLAIEELKSAQRSDIEERYAQLGESLGIIGVTVTPEIRRVALIHRNAQLARFRPKPC